MSKVILSANNSVFNTPNFNEHDRFKTYRVFDTTTSWNVTEEGWYRIICIGPCAPAKDTYFHFYFPENTDLNQYICISSGGTPGGSSGGLAISNLYLKPGENYNITIHNDYTKEETNGVFFDSLLCATAGKRNNLSEASPHPFGSIPLNLYGRSKISQITKYDCRGGISGEPGEGIGGNFINCRGFRGGSGGCGMLTNEKSEDPLPSHNWISEPGEASEDGNPGSLPLSRKNGGSWRSNAEKPEMNFEPFYRHGGSGGYASCPVCDATYKYYFLNPLNTKYLSSDTKTTKTHLIDAGNRVVVYGTSEGAYASNQPTFDNTCYNAIYTTRFPGCIIIEKFK